MRFVNIENTTAADNIGLTIIITATGYVTNPSLTHVEKDETLSIGTAYRPFTMDGGDMLTITTGRNDKHIMLGHSGDIVEVSQYISEDSYFFQLRPGDNHIAYAAASGEEYMTVEIQYAFEYEGA